MKIIKSWLCVLILGAGIARSQDMTGAWVDTAEPQPVLVHGERLIQAMDAAGIPLVAEQKAAFARLKNQTDAAAIAKGVQAIFDPLCLVGVSINPESRVKVSAGPAEKRLLQGGWTVFLVKVKNEAGVTAELAANSPQAQKVHGKKWDWNQDMTLEPRDAGKEQATVRDRWLELDIRSGRPLTPKLTGVKLEYRLIQLYSRDAGKRAAVLAFDVGQGTQDIGFRNDVPLTFDCAKATPVMINVVDENLKPTTAAFVIRDERGRVYPTPSKRLAPDFFFHDQIYRSYGETVNLPPGEYTVVYARGPESLTKQTSITVGDKAMAASFQIERWIDPSTMGYWSGDHHIHAAGCSHYTNPTIGVNPADMFRHIHGEDLKVGATLTWGPGFDHQKQFFTGKVDAASKHPYLIRYDIEVSGFGSHKSGHLCLLRLSEQMPKGGDSKRHWPTLGLNTLRWAKAQGAICGPAHTGWGLGTGGSRSKSRQPLPNTVPNLIVPPYNGIGANEYIVDVTHEVPGPDGKLVPAVDFLSACDTPWPSELNIWYHTLNCGFRTRMSGETDFPCIFDERVGLGRSYIRLDGDLSYDAWCEGISKGTGYVSEGRSHLIDLKVNDTLLGGADVQLAAPGSVKVTAKVAALLDDWVLAEPEWQLGQYGRYRGNERLRRIQHLSPYLKPYWHIERARVGNQRKVNVDVIVNGQVAAQQLIDADGKLRDVSFDVPLRRSSWVALRILGSSHTNPVFVTLGGKPVRASKASAEWCLKGVEVCWKEKKPSYAKAEMADAEAAYNHARAMYRQILAECEE